MATHGNALAGCLSATLQAVEIQKLLAGESPLSIAGREILFDPRYQVHSSSGLARNPACRFSHAVWDLEQAPNCSLAEAFGRAPGTLHDKSLVVPGSGFVSRLVCEACDRTERVWRLRESLDVFSLACPGCSSPRVVRGFDLVERLEAARLGPDDLARPLSSWGLRSGDIFALEIKGSGVRHFIVGHPGVQEATGLRSEGVTVVVAGLGNIGSFLAPHLARMDAIGRVVLCDPDRYESGQEIGQDVPAGAAGRCKAAVQCERLRAIRPSLQTEAFTAPIEELPTGELSGALVVSCLDSRAARLRLAARAWHVGSPFVDGAVEGGDSLLVRTNVYLPNPDSACFECDLAPEDYERLEQVFPCDTHAGRRRDSTSHASPREPLRAQPLPVARPSRAHARRS